jgi:hypothetical protein
LETVTTGDGDKTEDGRVWVTVIPKGGTGIVIMVTRGCRGTKDTDEREFWMVGTTDRRVPAGGRAVKVVTIEKPEGSELSARGVATVLNTAGGGPVRVEMMDKPEGSKLSRTGVATVLNVVGVGPERVEMMEKPGGSGLSRTGVATVLNAAVEADLPTNVGTDCTGAADTGPQKSLLRSPTVTH